MSQESAQSSANDGARKRAWSWIGPAYFGEGLPYAFLHALLTEYLTAIGAPPQQVARTSLFHAPVIFWKPIVSPAIDAFATRRRWMIVMQALIALGMAGTAWLVETSLGLSLAFWGLLTVIGVLHATHDVACDGLYMAALDRTGQALHSGTRSAAFRVAMYVGGSALVIVAARYDWTVAFGLAAMLMLAVAAWNQVSAPHPERDAKAARVLAGESAAVAQPRLKASASIRAFISQPAGLRVLAFVLLFGLSDAMTSSMSSPFLASLDVGTEARGWIRGFALFATIGAVFLGGWLVAKQGLARWLAPLTYAMATPFYLVIALLEPPRWLIAMLVISEQFAGNLAATALTIFLMRRCARAFSASHYAFFTSTVALGRMLAGYAAGELYAQLGGVQFFVLCLLVALPVVALVHFVPTSAIEDDARTA